MAEGVDDLVHAEAAGHLRMLLDEIAAGELTCSAAFRHRVEGAVLALDAAAPARPVIVPNGPA